MKDAKFFLKVSISTVLFLFAFPILASAQTYYTAPGGEMWLSHSSCTNRNIGVTYQGLLIAAGGDTGHPIMQNSDQGWFKVNRQSYPSFPAYQGLNNSRNDTTSYSNPIDYWAEYQGYGSSPGISEWIFFGLTVGCSTVTVSQSVPGGSWVLSTGQTGVSNQWTTPSWGINVSIGSIIPPSGYVVDFVSNSDGGGTALTIFPQQTKNFHIVYKLDNNNPPPGGDGSLSAPSLTAIPGGCDSATINLSWTRPRNATSYQLFRGGNMIYNGPNYSFSDIGLNPNQSYTYTVKAIDSVNNLESPLSSPVSVLSPDECGDGGGNPVSVSITAFPTTVTSGNSSTLTWSSSNATSCSASASPSNGQWSGGKVLNGNQTITNITSTTEFTITCTGQSGSADSSVTVNVSATPPPSVNLNANPTSVVSGGSSLLTWSSSNASTCSASSIPFNAQWSGSKSLSGSQNITNITSNTSFILNCTGPGGSGGSGASVYVSPPAVSIIAQPTTVSSGGTSELIWSSTGASSCTASANPSHPQWSGARSTGSDQFVDNITQTTEFTITCSNANGNTSASATVTVSGTAPGTPTGFTAVPGSCGTGTINLSWNTVPGAAGYRIFSPTNSLTVNIPSGGTSSYAYGGLTPGVNYDFQIQSYDSVPLYSSWSSIISATAPSSCVSFDYTLSNNGNVSVTKTASNATGQSTVTKTLTSGATQSISLSTTGAPDGVSALPSNQTCNLTCQSTIIFTVPSATPIGTYPITVTGTPGNKTTNFNLIINNPSAISASCSVSPAPAQIGQPVTWSVNVIGGSGSFTYLWSGDEITAPNPTTASFQKTYQSTGIKNANVVVTDTVSGGTASCPGGVLGQTQVQISVRPTFEEF